jgi:hypothetical protein
MEQANPFNRSPNRTIADILAVFQNVGMERFAVWRQAFAVRTKPSGPAPVVQERVPLDPERETVAHSKFGAVVVLLIPVAAVVWAAIGWLLYRLVT